MNIAADRSECKWRNTMAEAFAVGLVLLIFWAAMLASLRDKSLTFDEGAYAAAGCGAWRTGDYHLNPEAGLLPQRLAGLPLAAGSYRYPPPSDPDWAQGKVQYVGYNFFYRMGNNAGQMAEWGRAAAGLLAVALGWVVWAWSRSLFGAIGGMVSLFLYVLDPTVLANGALMTSDMAAAFFFAAATWAWWRALERLTWGRVLVSSLLVAGLFISKMSAVLFLPLMAVLAIARLIDSPARKRRAAGIAIAVVIHAAVAVVVIWSVYGFRFAAFRGPGGSDHFLLPWTDVLANGNANLPRAGLLDLPMRVLDGMRRHEVLPESWLYGLGVIIDRTQYGTAFWNGRYTVTGWPGYLPYTFLVKTPLSMFAIFALAAGAAFWRRPRGVAKATLPLWVFLALYGWASVVSHRDIGHRYLLPVYGPLFVLCGAAGWWLGDGGTPGKGAVWPRWVLLALFGCLGLEAAWRFPNYLSYFNGIVRPREAYRHVVDSSLDWGQDLPAAAQYIENHRGDGPFYLSYFGAASPAYYGITAIPLYSFGGRYLEGSGDLLFVPLEKVPDASAVAQLEAEHPDHDLIGYGPGRRYAIFLRKAGEMRLTPGTCLISATMLQSVCDWQVHGPWNPAYEARYQKFKEEAAPLLSNNYDARLAALSSRSLYDTEVLLYEYQQYRLARLAAYLRPRTPEAEINDSILVYRLTGADVAALERPLFHE